MEILKGKVILVTGGSQGIGFGISSALSAAGATVVVNYASNEQVAEEAVEKLIANGGTASAVKADITKPAEVAELFDQAIALYGKVDVLVNSAGVMLIKPLKDTTDEEFDKNFNTNVRGTFNTLREAANKLSDNGSIINISSSVNRVMLPGYGTYSASKAAVEQLTRILAKEIGERGINVNSISPGPTETPLFLKGKSQEIIDKLAAQSAFNRIGKPEDIGGLVVFLSSDEAKWVSAQNIGVNGGFA